MGIQIQEPQLYRLMKQETMIYSMSKKEKQQAHYQQNEIV